MKSNDPATNAPANVDPDILRSDPAQRRNVQWLIATMVAAALLLFLFGLPALKRWINVADGTVMLHRMSLVFYGLGDLLLATAAYASWYARRIFGSQQFPPPGTWVMRDTRVLRGDAARARGWWVLTCAIGFVLLATYTMLVLPRRLDGLMLPAPSRHAAQIALPHG